MFAEKVFGIALVLVLTSRGTIQHFSGCRESYFMHAGSCTPCLDRCATCISDVNCTKCNSNFYGPSCQYTCQEDCKELCHKEHGYCTYGCEDGLFPEQNSPLCAICPSKCKKCKSMTECVECITGYHGNTCGNRCSSFCEKCDKATGTCLECDWKYFNKGGRCHRCPDGCESCYDNNNCSSCKDGYLKVNDGQCIIECQINSNTIGPKQNVYSQGNLTLDGFTNKTHNHECVVKLDKPCNQFISCSPNMTCQREYGGTSVCGTFKTYQCTQPCRQLNDTHRRCEPYCTVKEDSSFLIIMWLSNKETFTVIKLSTSSEFFTDEPTSTTYQRPTTVSIIPIVSCLVVVPLCLAMAFYICCIKGRCRAIRKSIVHAGRSSRSDKFVLAVELQEQGQETTSLKQRGANTNGDV